MRNESVFVTGSLCLATNCDETKLALAPLSIKICPNSPLLFPHTLAKYGLFHTCHSPLAPLHLLAYLSFVVSGGRVRSAGRVAVPRPPPAGYSVSQSPVIRFLLLPVLLPPSSLGIRTLTCYMP